MGHKALQKFCFYDVLVSVGFILQFGSSLLLYPYAKCLIVGLIIITQNTFNCGFDYWNIKAIYSVTQRGRIKEKQSTIYFILYSGQCNV